MRQQNIFKETEIGNIPEEWEVKELENLGIVLTGKGTKKLEIGKYPIIGSNGLLGYTEDYLEDEDLIFTGRVGTIGRINFQKKEKIWLSDNVLYFKTKNIHLLNYVYYYLKKTDFSHLNVGSTQPLVKQSDFKKIKIALPKTENELIKIAKILSDLDSKIELNQQMNKTLEAIGQALFKHWFIDFEFPNEKGKPYKASGGEMVDSELGEIPKEWEIREINDCGKVICGKTPSTQNKEYYGTDIPFITIPDMRDNVFVVNTEKSLSEAGGESQSKKELPPFAVCVSCIATPGLVSLTNKRSHTNQQINSIICNEGISPYFIFFSMKNKSEDIKTMGLGGTATLNVNTGDFSKIKLVVPNSKTMKELHKLLEPIFNQILNNTKEGLTLSHLRDSLLPRLMLGKIRVGVERVA